MARKKKVVIVDQELTPTVLATKKEKKGSVIWILFIFIIFIGVVIYLPDIAVYVEDYLNPQVDVPNTPSKTSTVKIIFSSSSKVASLNFILTGSTLTSSSLVYIA